MNAHAFPLWPDKSVKEKQKHLCFIIYQVHIKRILFRLVLNIYYFKSLARFQHDGFLFPHSVRFIHQIMFCYVSKSNDSQQSK